jgi:peptidoglycan/xylan/chitin deacetylase (PgdA/CDA1 family)
MLDVYGYKATSFMVPAWLGNPGFMTLANAHTWYDAQNDIGNHGYNSISATGQSVATIQADYEDYITWANNNGVERASLHMAYPDGIFNDNSDTAFANAGLLTGRTIKNSLNTGQGNLAYMHSLLLMSTNILSDYTDALAKVKAVGGILYVVIHDVVETPTESYQISTTLLGQIFAATDIEVLTISKAFAALQKAKYV